MKGEKMAGKTIQALLGAAMIDGSLEEMLLDPERRKELLPKLQLTDEECEFLLGIKADSLQGFAATVDQWLGEGGGFLERLWLKRIN